MNLDAHGNNEKTIVLVNRAIYLPGEGGYKRTMYLFDMMKKNGHHPILLTSDFNHYNKKQRDVESFARTFPEYSDIVFLHTRPYKKNISFQRRIAENDWKNEVKKWVKQNKKNIDGIMMSMPDMNTILAVNKVCKPYDIEITVDVRDLRPEAFKVLIKNECLYRILTYPMKLKANKAYACADKLFAVSDEYLKRGSVKNTHAKVLKTVYIGADIDKFDAGVKKYSNRINKSNNELWLTYVGTLGASYDLITVIDAVNRLKDNIYYGKKLRFMVFGQGPDKESFEEYANEIGANNVEFMGFVPYDMMAAYLSKSDITINAIKKRGSQSIINKVADYFAAGIPMLNGCSCIEQREMVDKYSVGKNYEAENVDDLAKAIDDLLNNPELCKLYGNNARKLAEEKFDRGHTYNDIIQELYN